MDSAPRVCAIEENWDTWTARNACQKDEDCSTDALSDLAALESDDEVAPPMQGLYRHCTHTFYNDVAEFEWGHETRSEIPSAATPFGCEQPTNTALGEHPDATFDAYLSWPSNDNHANQAAFLPASEAAVEQREWTPLEKELRKLQKKLNEMSKLQAALDAGGKLDKLQLVKLEKRPELENGIQSLENAVAAEKALCAAKQTHCTVSASSTNALTDAGAQRQSCQPSPPFQKDGQKPFHSHVGCNAHQISSQLVAGGERNYWDLAQLRGRVVELSFDAAGCRLVQQAMQAAGKDEINIVVWELHGFVTRLMQSPHGNYVIQKVVESLPPAMSTFVSEELLGVAGAMARHRYGCRVLCRLFEHCADDAAVAALVDELMIDITILSRDVFAHHVIQALLEHGQPEHRRLVADALAPRSFEHAQHRSASYVLETALIHGSPSEQQLLASSILSGGPRRIEAMACSQAGGRVLKALLNVQRIADSVWQTLCASAEYLKTNKQGRRFLHDIKMC